ncbi:MAG: DNA polymerase III subunit beta [Bacteroidales bacterium]|jgi:DNA polymerase-3 subunit beta|nr:DNA polymerase III subunit beta [Bacteroidales bacterium]
MKFIVDKDLLFKNLSAINGVIVTNNSLSILENFLFTVSGSQLTVTASDLDTTMSAVIELTNVEGEGSVAVPSKLLMETLKLLPVGPVVFAIDLDSNVLKFTAGNGEYDAPCFPGDEFPQAPEIVDPGTFDIDPTVLLRSVSKTLFATGTDELRPQMMGVLCELSSENMTMVATDAHKLVRYRNTTINTTDFVSFILSKKPLLQLKNNLPAVSQMVNVQYSTSTSHIRFAYENIVLLSRLKEGKFPNYEAVIPTENTNVLVIQREDLLRSIRRVGIYASQSTFQIRISLSEDTVHIMAQDTDYSNKAEETLSGQYSGEPMDIGFNSKFLREILENMDSDKVRLEMSQPNRAALILPEKEDIPTESLLMLIMPVML